MPPRVPKRTASAARLERARLQKLWKQDPEAYRRERRTALPASKRKRLDLLDELRDRDPDAYWRELREEFRRDIAERREQEKAEREHERKRTDAAIAEWASHRSKIQRAARSSEKARAQLEDAIRAAYKLREGDPAMSLSEIAEAAGLSKSGVYQIIHRKEGKK
jgi:hypothetical protein